MLLIKNKHLEHRDNAQHSGLFDLSYHDCHRSYREASVGESAGTELSYLRGWQLWLLFMYLNYSTEV